MYEIYKELLDSWVKAVEVKNAYRDLLQEWVNSDEHIKNKFEALLTEWAASEVEVVHQAVLDDWAGYENRKANPRENWLQEIVDKASKTEQFKHWLLEWAKKVSKPSTNNNKKKSHK